MATTAAANRRGHGRKCLVIHTAQTPIGDLMALLRGAGLEPLGWDDVVSQGVTIAEAISNAISRADVVVAVLSQTSENANIFFELGYAAALDKPILIIVPPSYSSLPSDLAGMLYIRADLGNQEAIKFALEQLIAAPQSSVKHKGKRPKGSKPILDKADELLHVLRTAGSSLSPYQLEQIVLEALTQTNLTAVAQSSKQDKGADFAVWIDEVDPILGNPLLIEVKLRISSRNQAEEVKQRVMKYLESTLTRFGVVIYADGISSDLLNQTTASPSVLFLQLDELLESMRHSSLGEILVTKRNEVVHGGGK